ALDGTTKQIRCTRHDTNEATVSGDPTVHDETEDVNVVNGNLIASGTIPITDADQNQASFQAGVTGAQGNLGSLTLQSNGSYTYTVANSAVQYLGANDTKVDTFTVTALDGTTKQISFTIHGSNDAPDITGTAVSATKTETDTTLSATGTLNVVDVDLADTVLVTVDSVAVDPSSTFSGSNPLSLAHLKTMMAVSPLTALAADPAAGSNVSWTFTSGSSGDGAFNFLRQGETLVLNYTLKATDNAATALTDTQLVTITITGSNDAPDITAPAAEDTAVKEAGGVSNTTAGDPSASGQLTVHDVDSGQDHFQTPTSLAGNYGTYTFNATTGAWTYTLNQTLADPLTDGQVVHDHLTVTSFDGTAPYANDVTITGTTGNETITASASDDTAVK